MYSFEPIVDKYLGPQFLETSFKNGGAVVISVSMIWALVVIFFGGGSLILLQQMVALVSLYLLGLYLFSQFEKQTGLEITKIVRSASCPNNIDQLAIKAGEKNGKPTQKRCNSFVLIQDDSENDKLEKIHPLPETMNKKSFFISAEEDNMEETEELSEGPIEKNASFVALTSLESSKSAEVKKSKLSQSFSVEQEQEIAPVSQIESWKTLQYPQHSIDEKSNFKQKKPKSKIIVKVEGFAKKNPNIRSIKKLFENAGAVRYVRLLHDREDTPYALVEYKTQESADTAVYQNGEWKKGLTFSFPRNQNSKYNSSTQSSSKPILHYSINQQENTLFNVEPCKTRSINRVILRQPTVPEIDSKGFSFFSNNF